MTVAPPPGPGQEPKEGGRRQGRRERKGGASKGIENHLPAVQVSASSTHPMKARAYSSHGSCWNAAQSKLLLADLVQRSDPIAS